MKISGKNFCGNKFSTNRILKGKRRKLRNIQCQFTVIFVNYFIGETWQIWRSSASSSPPSSPSPGLPGTSSAA
jgi:hypothetical protein